MYAFPFGIGRDDSVTNIHVAKNGHSSGLLSTYAPGLSELIGTEDGASWDWRKEVKTTKSIPIHVVTLETIIELLPFAEVDYLKIDSQGFDLEVFRSAGKYRQNIRRVKLEAKAEGTKGFYDGQPAPSEIIAEMLAHGFKHTASRKSCCKEKLMEVDMVFDNLSKPASSNDEDFSKDDTFLPTYP